MRQWILLLAVLAAGLLHAQDDDYQMYQTIMLTPHDGQQQQLFAAVKAHNDNFHKEGKESVNVWSVQNGPDAGSLLWVKGPIMWSDMDNPIEGDSHMDDWWSGVMQHCTMTTMEFWRLWDDLEQMPDGLVPRVMVVRYQDIHQQKWNNVKHMWSSVIKLRKDKNFDSGLRIFTNSANAGDGRDVALIWHYDSYSSMDKDRNFFSQYEEAYGINRREYFENMNEITDFKGMQILNLVPELSVIGSD